MIPRWLVWTFVAILSWGFWAILSRALDDSVSAIHSQVLSTVGMVPVFLAMLPQVKSQRRSPGTAHQRRRGPWIAFVSGLVSCLGNIGYYQVIASGDEKATTIVPLSALYPVVTVLLAVVLLGERLNRLQWLGILLSLVAIYLLNVQKEGDWFSSWLLLLLVPVVLWGLTGFLQKLSTDDTSGEESSVWFLLAFLLVAPVLYRLDPIVESVSGRTWFITSLLGFTLALGNYAMLAAFAYQGKAAIITPLSSLYPLVSIPLAAWWFQEGIGPREVVGIAVSLLAVVCLSIETRASAAEAPSV